MPAFSVEITQSGRSGSVYYHEGEYVVAFDWEFAMSPAIVLVMGTPEDSWDQTYGWAAGRQQEIFSRVCEELGREKARNCWFAVDLHLGTITVYPKYAGSGQPEFAWQGPSSPEAPPPKGHSPAYDRFMKSVPKAYEPWNDDQCYDVAAISQMTEDERAKIFRLLSEQELTWREVVAIAEFQTPEARLALEEALSHHLSIDVRLAAAASLERQGRMLNAEAFLAPQIRLLIDPRQGLKRALEMAERHPTEKIKQALLWASYNQTECAPHCARLLLKLTAAVSEPLAPPLEEMLMNLGLHNSFFTRQAAFEKLSHLVGMELEPGAAE